MEDVSKVILAFSIAGALLLLRALVIFKREPLSAVISAIFGVVSIVGINMMSLVP